MPHLYESAATRIIDWYHLAERDLIGHEVTTFNGATAVVRAVKLDEHHGLCFSFDGREWRPVSTIKVHGLKVNRKKCADNASIDCVGHCANGCYITGMGMQGIWP